MGAGDETRAPLIIRQMLEARLVAPRMRLLLPDGLLHHPLLKVTTCKAAMALDLRTAIPGLCFEEMAGVGAKTYAEYKRKFSAEPTAFALYAAEAGGVAIDGIRRAAAELDRASNIADKRDLVRKAIAATKSFNG